METNMEKQLRWIGIYCHDCKAPLSAARISLEMIQQKYPHISKDISYVLKTIDKTFDYVQKSLEVIKQGPPQYSIQSYHVDDFLDSDSSLCMFAHQLEQSQNTLKIQIQEELKDYLIQTDKQAIAQILQNLVSNSIKFTQNGTIQIDAEISSEQELKIKVKDSGKGIEKDISDKMFLKYTKSNENNYQGSGLGLYNCCEILQELTGKGLQFNSEKGKGSIFYFFLPIIKQIRSRQESSELPHIDSDIQLNINIRSFPQNTRRTKHYVMILDDDEFISHTLQEIISFIYRQQYSINPIFIIINNLQDLENVHIDKNSSTLAIVDKNIGNNCGFEMFKFIKKKFEGKMFSIGSSGSKDEKIMKSSTQMGIDCFIEKPLKLDLLNLKIQQFLLQ